MASASHLLALAPILLLALLSTSAGQEAGQPKKIDPLMIEAYCKNFTEGRKKDMEFYSPNYPSQA